MLQSGYIEHRPDNLISELQVFEKPVLFSARLSVLSLVLLDLFKQLLLIFLIFGSVWLRLQLFYQLFSFSFNVLVLRQPIRDIIFSFNEHEE